MLEKGIFSQDHSHFTCFRMIAYKTKKTFSRHEELNGVDIRISKHISTMDCNYKKNISVVIDMKRVPSYQTFDAVKCTAILVLGLKQGSQYILPHQKFDMMELFHIYYY